MRVGSKVRRHFDEKLYNRTLKPTGKSAADGNGAIIARAYILLKNLVRSLFSLLLTEYPEHRFIAGVLGGVGSDGNNNVKDG